jgi:hypothetical protein
MIFSQPPPKQGKEGLGCCVIIVYSEAVTQQSQERWVGPGASYFVNIGRVGVGGVAAAGERLNVSQRFQPAGRFSLANSP